MISFIRIDDRLIHGQVVEGWVNYLKATCIVVADDEVASNPLQRSILEISVPQGLTVVVDRVMDACGRLLAREFDSERVILLFSKPSDVLLALKAGLDCQSLNIGGMHFVPGKRKLLDMFAVDDSDLKALKEIAAMGIKVQVQAVPTQRPLSLDKVFTACHVG